jgi:hypothetical protein
MKKLIRNVSLGLFLLLIFNQCVSKQEKGRSIVSSEGMPVNTVEITTN